MQVTTSKDLLSDFDNNLSAIAKYCNITRNTVRSHIDKDGIVIIDGVVFVRKSSVTDESIGFRENRKHHVGLVQSVLEQTGSVDETAELMCEGIRYKLRSSEAKSWRLTILRWIDEGVVTV